MSSKTLLKFLGGCLILVLLFFGLKVQDSSAQVALTGKTNVPSSQIVAPFDTRQGRNTWIQLTNTLADPVNVHIQVLIGEDCFERDFFDTLTPNDTVIYDLSDFRFNPTPGSSIFANEQDGGGLVPISADTKDTMGVIIFTPVVAANFDNSAPISHQGLHGVVHWSNNLDDDNSRRFETLYTWNAMGRDAVLSDGSIAADSTVLDGAAAFYERIQPNSFNIHYTDDFITDSSQEDHMFSDVIMVAINDSYGGGTYTPSAGTTPVLDVVVVDRDENSSSCGQVSYTCKEVVGLNNENPASRVILARNAADGDTDAEMIADCKADLASVTPSGDVTANDCEVICPSGGADFFEGFTRLRAVSSTAEAADAYFGILGLSTSDQGGAVNIHVR